MLQEEKDFWLQHWVEGAVPAQQPWRASWMKMLQEDKGRPANRGERSQGQDSSMNGKLMQMEKERRAKNGAWN